MDSPRKLLAFRTFAYIRVGILLGRLLVEHDVEPDESTSWAEQLRKQPGAPRARWSTRWSRWPRRSPPTLPTRTTARPERGGAGALRRVREAPSDRGQLKKSVTPPPSLLIMRGRWGSGSRYSWRWRVSSSCSQGRAARAARGSTAGASARACRDPRGRARARPARRPARSRRRPTTPPSAPSFAYPADGSVVSTGSISASASSDSGTSGVAERHEPGAVAQPLRRRDHGRHGQGRRARGSTEGRTAKGDFSGAGSRRSDGARPGRRGRAERAGGARRLGLPRDARAGHRHELRRRRHAGLPRLRDRARRPPDRAARRAAGRLGDPGRLRGGERAGQRRAAAEADRARPGGQAPEHAKRKQTPVAPEPTQQRPQLARRC